MNFAAAASHLYCKLVVESQRYLAAFVQRLGQYHSSVNLLAHGHVPVENLQSAEQRSFLHASLPQVLRVYHIQSALSAYQYQSVGGIAHRALVVRSVLQSVAVVVASHHEVPRAVVLFLRYHVSHTMVSSHPDGVLVVFDDAVYRRAEQSRLHVEQIAVVGLHVPDERSRCRALPYQSAAVFQSCYRRLVDHQFLNVFAGVEVYHLPGLGMNQREVIRVRHQ